MKHYLLLSIALIVAVSCKQEPKNMGWKYSHSIAVDGINPIGIALARDGLWLSDGDHFRVVRVNEEGVIVQAIDSLDRPMHITTHKGQLVIPQYGNDEVIRMTVDEERFREPASPPGRSEKIIISLSDSLDAPAGADIRANEIAIADFYNNKVHYAGNDNLWIAFGKEGKAEGEFYYPTDVQITEDALWVADAYNNRLQKFTKKGEHLLTVGEDQNMNAATGIYVSDTQVFSTDFENDRVLVFDQEGNYKQSLTETIEKPTDVLIKDGLLYVANYKSSSLSVYMWGELEPIEENHQEHQHDEHEVLKDNDVI